MAITDLVELSTTVTAVSGSIVTLANVSGLAVGDRIIIESQHGYDETGLDGDWDVDLPVSSDYYIGVTHWGKSFLGTVSGISGNNVTLDRTVPVGASGLPFYRNNADAIEYAINNRISFPTAKVLAFATDNTRPLRCYTTPDQYTYDFNGCEIFTPRGCGPASIQFYSSEPGGGPTHNKIYRNLTMRGNARDSGYGFSAETGELIFDGSAFPTAFRIEGTSGEGGTVTTNQHLEGCTFIDNWRAVSFSLASGCTATNCLASFTGPLRSYIQWEFLAANSINCWFIECAVDTDYSRPAFSAFSAERCGFISCSGRNAFFESNSSGGTFFKDCSVLWDTTDPGPWSPNTPLLSLQRVYEDQVGSALGTTGYIRVENFSAKYNATPYVDQIYYTILVDVGDWTEIVVDVIGLVFDASAVGTPASPTSDGYAMISTANNVTLSNYIGPQWSGRAPFLREGVSTPWNNTRAALFV